MRILAIKWIDCSGNSFCMPGVEYKGNATIEALLIRYADQYGFDRQQLRGSIIEIVPLKDEKPTYKVIVRKCETLVISGFPYPGPRMFVAFDSDGHWRTFGHDDSNERPTRPYTHQEIAEYLYGNETIVNVRGLEDGTTEIELFGSK